jgi:hypothetical protein
VPVGRELLEGGPIERQTWLGGEASLEEILLRTALGESLPAPRLVPGAAGVMMLPIPERGILRRVEGQARARMVPNIEHLEITAPVGVEVMPPPEGSTYLGFLFARSDTPDRVETALKDAHRHLTPVIEPAPLSGH